MEFISIFKTALFKFYKIKSYKRSQDDMFVELVKEHVLDSDVSDILIKAANDEFKEENDLFSQGLSFFAKKELAFWVSPADA